jgi:uncharacterized membrane protein YhhN
MMLFAGGVESLANGTLVLSVIMAAYYAMIVSRPPSLRRTMVKTGAVALLAVLASAQGGPPLLIAALALGAVGDACLAQDGEPSFLAGLGAFLFAHLAYVALFWSHGGGVAEIVSEPSRVVIGGALAAAVGIILSRLWPSLGTPMRLPVALYCLAILAMGISSLADLGPTIVAGALLFMASDALLAVGRFVLPPEDARQGWMRPLVWVLYYAAQLLLTLSFIRA